VGEEVGVVKNFFWIVRGGNSKLPYFLHTSYYWCTHAGRAVLYDVEGVEGFELSGGGYKKRFGLFGLCLLKRALVRWRVEWDSWL